MFYIQRPQEYMRKTPEVSEIVSETFYSEEVEPLEERGDWVRIRTKMDRYEGWVRKGAFVRCEREFFEGIIAKVYALKAHIYRAPGRRGGPIVSLCFGSRLKVIEQNDAQWIKIALLNGLEGFVERGNISFESGTLTKEKIVELSKRFLEVPYTWGGRTSFGFDCSGFVQMLYREMGVDLPRDSKDQVVWGGLAPVALEEKEPGDLIFFGKDAQSISHVGMSIGGDRFIHATTRESKPWIHISDLSDREWNGSGEFRFCTVRRLRAVV